MEYVYAAKFEANEGGYTVTFPDLLGAVTEGDSLQQAIDMAEDCLGGYLYTLEADGETAPKPTAFSRFHAPTESEFYSLVKIDLAEYKRKLNDAPIKKTVYISKGLNDQAEQAGINFSQVLREALSARLARV